MNFSLSSNSGKLLCFVLVPAMYYEVFINITSVTLHKDIKDLTAKPGCHELSQEEWVHWTNNRFIPEWSFPFLTLLHNHNEFITSVVIPPIYNDKNVMISSNFCQLSEDGLLKFNAPWGTHFIDTKGAFDFSKFPFNDSL
jgi:hypothetical protein